ncbi:MAG: vitamin K epoxide reductase family protein [Candidatus Eremiobacteraeota bacterium]|nr:vitamin K epoxide reductase family protein [Candidatus Eremiobacteraeota bacterium]
MTPLVISICITVLCVVGLYVSSHMYAKSLRYEYGAGEGPSVVESPRARILGGIPNSAYGLAYYGAMLIASWALHIPFIWIGALVAASAAALMSAYLAYSLLFKTKRQCPYCWTSHALNWSILVLLVADGFALGHM